MSIIKANDGWFRVINRIIICLCVLCIWGCWCRKKEASYRLWNVWVKSQMWILILNILCNHKLRLWFSWCCLYFPHLNVKRWRFFTIPQTKRNPMPKNRQNPFVGIVISKLRSKWKRKIDRVRIHKTQPNNMRVKSTKFNVHRKFGKFTDVWCEQ